MKCIHSRTSAVLENYLLVSLQSLMYQINYFLTVMLRQERRWNELY